MTARTRTITAKAAARTTERPLGEACVDEALAVIAQDGLEGLSLREVARRLGVSHQAPYKHFKSRDHLLAEAMRRCFRQFAASLRAAREADTQDGAGDPMGAMNGLGGAYLAFARDHPLEYRLMFGTPWPDVADHPDLLRDARYAFDVLRDGLRALHAQAGPVDARRVDLDAIFVWSSMHGLASLMESSAMAHLDLPDAVAAAVPAHAKRLIDAALLAGRPPKGRQG